MTENQRTEQQQAIDRVYDAVDDLVKLLPGWTKYIMKATEPMFQTLDTIENLFTKENETDDDTTNE